MTRPTPKVCALYDQEMAAAAVAGDPERCWAHLAWLHTRNHVAILALALGQGDRREALGQVLRILVAAPGSSTGRFPEGNTGRVAAGPRTPMALPADLAAALHR